MKTPLYCFPPPHFFKFCLPRPSPPSPQHRSLSPPTPTPTTCSIVLFLWLNGWLLYIWCAVLLNDSMDLHMSSHGTLAPERSWYVLYAKRVKFIEIWHMLWFLLVLWFDITYKHKQYTPGPVDWHTHIIYIYTNCYMLTAATFITLNDYFRPCLFSKIIHLRKSFICWLDAVRLGSSCETQIILIER